MRPYYSKEVIQRFLYPKNFGKIKNADGIGGTQNIRCGDVMKLYLKVKKEKGREIIKEIKFETMGCGHAISISDIMCDLARGKTLEQALKIDYDDIVKKLGSIPPAKIHCSYLARSALKAAIEDYYKKRKRQ